MSLPRGFGRHQRKDSLGTASFGFLSKDGITRTLIWASLLWFAGCSSDGSSSGAVDPVSSASSGSSSGTGAVTLTWQPGVFESPNRYANQCAVPRTGTDPSSGQPFPDRAGTALHEKMWLRSFTHLAYYWYDDVVDVDPAPFTVQQYYDNVLKAEHDKFHFSQPYEQYIAAYEEGVSVDYGIIWDLNHSAEGLEVRVKQVSKTAAAAAYVSRGDEVLEVDGQPLARIDNPAVLLEGLYPEVAGETHSFIFSSADSDEEARQVELVAQPVQYAAVPQYRILNTDHGRIGYLEFYSHNMTSERALTEAIQHFYEEGVEDLIIDMRYNQGGQLFVASQLAFMVAGSGRTIGRTFERFRYNDKHPVVDPFGETITPLPFIPSTFETFGGNEVTLPSLDLPRVFVLTSGETCSASESFINSLRGIDVDVIQIGTSTCGKPYGYLPTHNCGMVYYMVMFAGVNDRGFGEFQSGFRASGSDHQDEEALLPGCEVVDDLAWPLGDVNEPLLAAALQYHATGECPADRLQDGSFQAMAVGRDVPGPRLQRGYKLYTPLKRSAK